MLTSRLQIVADKLIGPDSTGTPLVNLGQSKAFDRVDHRYLKAKLAVARFGEGFRAWIGLLYQAPSVVVQMNGKSFKPFNITRSMRQGCHLLPLLYGPVLEPFILKLKGGPLALPNPGIRLSGGVTARVSAYGDYVTVCVFSSRDISWVSSEIQRYERAIWARLNRSKSVGLRPGAWKERSLPGTFE